MSSHSPQSERGSRIQKIVDAFRVANDAGISPAIESVVEKNPDLADELRPLLTAIEQGTESDEAMIATAVNGEVDAQESADSPSDSFLPADATLAHRAGGSSSSVSDENVIRGASMLGKTIGGYRLLRLLGHGGMGEVYEAEEIKTRRHFALKMLSARLPRNDETVERFLNEASLAASLQHPRTTFVYGAGHDDQKFFIVMELMPGETLKDEVEQRGQLPISEAVDHVIDILDGLDAAHQKGIIHRDLKPSNCFVDAEGRTKVGDFGLAKSLISNADITQTGTFLGTPQFAAPEQVRHEKVDPRTDVFSVGATLFYLLTSQAPFQGDAAAVIAQIVADEPPPIRSIRPDIPKSLQRMIARCMSKKPKRRYQSVSELRRALLPFSNEGVSMADVGRRLAAYFLDTLLVSILAVMATAIIQLVNLGLREYQSELEVALIPSFALTVALFAIPYFAICETIWGWTFGKRWLGIRVVNSYGDSPSLWRSIVRALILPGIFVGLAEVSEVMLMKNEEFTSFTTEKITDEVLHDWLVPSLFNVVKLAIVAVCCSTMTRNNGYRGLHEILSGTRTVRSLRGKRRSIFRWLELYRSPPEEREGLPDSLAAYDVLGAIGKYKHIDVLLADDKELKRSVWMYWSPRELGSWWQNRAAVQRPTRQRYLQSGTQDEYCWYAIESIDGGPLNSLFNAEGTISWEVGREVLPDLAAELDACVHDGTLPRTVGIDQLWLDKTGGLRLLDFPLHAPASPKSHIADEVSRAWSLFREIVGRCRWNNETPGNVADYLAELEKQTPTQKTFANVCERLREAVKSPFRLDWDRRLGLLGDLHGDRIRLLFNDEFPGGLRHQPDDWQHRRGGCDCRTSKHRHSGDCRVCFRRRAGFLGFRISNSQHQNPQGEQRSSSIPFHVGLATSDHLDGTSRRLYGERQHGVLRFRCRSVPHLDRCWFGRSRMRDRSAQSWLARSAIWNIHRPQVAGLRYRGEFLIFPGVKIFGY